MSQFITTSREETVALAGGWPLPCRTAPSSRLPAVSAQARPLSARAWPRALAAPTGQQPHLCHRELLPRPAPFAHFDLYRISTENDLCAAGFYDYLDQGAIVAAEWSENFADLLALEDPIRIHIERLDDTTRRITIEGVEL